MKQPVFQEILEQIKDLKITELQELDAVIQHYFSEKKKLLDKVLFIGHCYPLDWLNKLNSLIIAKSINSNLFKFRVNLSLKLYIEKRR